MIKIYTDGSCLKNPGNGGWAAIINIDNKFKKIKNLINGYETIRLFTKKEKDAVNILCRGAALRYLLTRIYDYFNTPKTALIKIKNPNEYLQKLIFHNNLNSYKDYYK